MEGCEGVGVGVGGRGGEVCGGGVEGWPQYRAIHTAARQYRTVPILNSHGEM